MKKNIFFLFILLPLFFCQKIKSDAFTDFFTETLPSVFSGENMKKVFGVALNSLRIFDLIDLISPPGDPNYYIPNIKDSRIECILNPSTTLEENYERTMLELLYAKTSDDTIKKQLAEQIDLLNRKYNLIRDGRRNSYWINVIGEICGNPKLEKEACIIGDNMQYAPHVGSYQYCTVNTKEYSTLTCVQKNLQQFKDKINRKLNEIIDPIELKVRQDLKKMILGETQTNPLTPGIFSNIFFVADQNLISQLYDLYNNGKTDFVRFPNNMGQLFYKKGTQWSMPQSHLTSDEVKKLFLSQLDSYINSIVICTPAQYKIKRNLSEFMKSDKDDISLLKDITAEDQALLKEEKLTKNKVYPQLNMAGVISTNNEKPLMGKLGQKTDGSYYLTRSDNLIESILTRITHSGLKEDNTSGPKKALLDFLHDTKINDLSLLNSFSAADRLSILKIKKLMLLHNPIQKNVNKFICFAGDKKEHIDLSKEQDEICYIEQEIKKGELKDSFNEIPSLDEIYKLEPEAGTCKRIDL